jgi:translocation and assembly module TamB
VSPSFASLQNGELVAAKTGRITFNLRTALNKWAFTNTSPFTVSADASKLNLAELAQAAGMQTPISGTLNLNVNARGTELNPTGNGSLSLNNAKVSGENIQSAALKFNGTGDQVNGTLNVSMPAGPMDAVFAYLPKTQGYDLNLQANGLKLDQLQTVKARNLDLHGVLNLVASGRGTIKDPQLTASLRIPQLTLQGQTISGIALQTAVANDAAQFTLDSQALNSGMHGQGTVQLTGDYYTDAKLDTQRIPLQPLVALYAPSQAGNIAGATELHATLQGPLKNKQLLTAHVIIPMLQMSYKNKVQLGAAQPIHIDFSNGVLALQRTSIKGTDTDLQVQASVPVSSSAPMSLMLQGTVDLQLAQLLSPDLQTSGQLVFDVNSFGARSDQNVQGQVRVVNASFASGSAPIGLQNGNGVLTLTNNRLDITQFTGTVGGGTLEASGGVVYRPNLQFGLAMSGQGIRMLYPAGMREALSANLALNGNMNAATLSGQVNLDQLSFTPEFDLMNFAGQFSGDVSAPSTGGFMDNLKLNIGLHSNGGVNLVSRTLSLQATANLDVRGTAAEPVVLGRVNVSGGDLIFRGNRYILQGATLDFINPVRTQPVVNASVTTTIQQYNIEMRFWGPADHLHTNYASDPALPPADVINLLAFGTTTEASAANPNPPGNLGAESLIASQVSSQITSRVEKIAGISQLSIDPVLAGSGSGQNPGARVTIQQRVTSNLFVTFSTDVTSTQSQAIQLQYKMSPRTSFSATRDQNGGFGFDVKIKKSW